MAVCQEAEPKVIDDNMIQKAIYDQGPKGEAGKIAREEGLPIDEVQSLRLEFLRILRIDHLWMLTGLTKLSLSNNLIEKIENLDDLVNLTDLDLSFNKIERIENLTKLENLEILTLFSNLITKIENLDTLKKLYILSLGNNNLRDTDDILYLRSFKDLNSLNLAGNPFCEENNFRLFIAAFLPNLVYYEYKMITEIERSEGAHMFSKKMRVYKEEEDIKKAQELELEAQRSEEDLYADSFIEFLGGPQLFYQLFEADPEGSAMAHLNEDTEELLEKFKEDFVASTVTLFHYGQEQCQLRKDEVKQYTKVAEGAKFDSQLDGIVKMEEFLATKDQLHEKVRKMQEGCDNGSITMNDYMEKVHEVTVSFDFNIQATWKHLMSLEITLFEQIEEIDSVFEQNITELINSFIETAQSIFTTCRDLESGFTESLNELIAKVLSNTESEGGPIPPILVPLFADREVLANSIATSHDYRTQRIDKREDVLVQKARQWLRNLVDDLQRNEIKRHRGKVLEINHFLDVLREQYEDLCSGFFYAPEDGA